MVLTMGSTYNMNSNTSSGLRTSANRDIWIVGVILALTLFLSSILQFVLMESYKHIVLSLLDDFSARGLDKGGLVHTVLQSLGASDILVGVGLFVSAVALFILQIKRKTVSAFLDYMLETNSRTYLLILFLTILFIKPIIAGGEPFFMDAPVHMSRAWFTSVNFQQGYWFPSFNNYYHNGFAMFSHYGFLFSVLAGGLNLAVGDINLSVKLVMLTLSIANASLFYRLGIALFGTKAGGLLLSVIITGSNLYLYKIMWDGVLLYPMLLFGAGLMLLSFERFSMRGWGLYRGAFLTAIGSALLAATHLGFTAQILLIFAVWVIARTFLFHRDQLPRVLAWTGLSALIAMFMTAFVYLPTIVDIKDVNFYKSFPFSDPNTYKFWQAPLWQLLVPRLFSSYMLRYMGLVLVGLSVVGLVLSGRTRDRWFWLHSIVIVFAIVVQGYTDNELILLLALALFAPRAVWLIAARKDTDQATITTRTSATLGMVFLLLLVDSLVCNNFNTYSSENGFEHDMFNRLAKEQGGESFGVVKANSLHSGNKPGNDVFVSPWAKVVGHKVLQPNAIMLEANKQALYQFGITNDLLVNDIREGNLSNRTLQGLDLLGIKYLTFHTAFQYYIPKVQSDGRVVRTERGPWIELPGTSPVLFSERVEKFEERARDDKALQLRARFESDDRSHTAAPFFYREYAGTYLHRIIELTNPNLTSAVADRFLLRAGSTENRTSPGLTTISVGNYTVDAQKVTLDFSVNKAGFVRVPFAYFPYHAVSLNSKPTAFYPDAMNMICIPIDTPGTYHLTIGPSLSRARTIGAWITGLGALAFLVGFVIVEIRRTLGRHGSIAKQGY